MKLGMSLNRMAFYYSGYCLRGGDDWLPAPDAKAKGIETVDESINIFKEVYQYFLCIYWAKIM